MTTIDTFFRCLASLTIVCEILNYWVSHQYGIELLVLELPVFQHCHKLCSC